MPRVTTWRDEDDDGTFANENRLMTLMANVNYRTYHLFARLYQLTSWWHWLIVLVVCAGVLSYVVWIYRRDSAELRRGIAASLLLLRIVVFAGVLFAFFDLEKRGEHQIVKDSRVVLLVDTSQSMGIREHEASQGNASHRLETVLTGFTQRKWIEDLQRKHEVIAYRFDQSSTPTEIASLPKQSPTNGSQSPVALPDKFSEAGLSQARKQGGYSLGLLIIGLILTVCYTVRRPSTQATSWLMFASVCFFCASQLCAAATHLRRPEMTFAEWIGIESPSDDFTIKEPAKPFTSPPVNNETSEQSNTVVWSDHLVPKGVETRLGEALRYVVEKERGGSIAAIVVFTDGNSNSGIKPEAVAEMAKRSRIPIYAVGIGSNRKPVNVRLTELRVPPRVFPGDAFTITAFVQAHGLKNRWVEVELASTDDIGQEADFDKDAVIEDQQRVRLEDQEQVVSVRFEVTPSETGRRVYQVNVHPLKSERNSHDNQKQAVVRVVERNSRVLLFAGGPTREYRFVRNLMFRDQRTTIDVLLQSAKSGISQEADEILFEFPSHADELFQYDAMIAFDVDWTKLDQNQIELLERWVAEKAGGLVLVAGPVHTPNWTALERGNPRLDTIRALYPVIFYGQTATTFHLGRTGGAQAWPLEFTAEGHAAEFLWLDESALGSQRVWSSFSGVYGYFAAKNHKKSARVYARFNDPQIATAGELPVYLAGHFYGGGRVFYMASGEMWRLRALDESYFEQFYTKLIRFVSQGRLLRDSSRGLLLVDKERSLLGETLTVRAVLADAQHRPLKAAKVAAQLVLPDGSRQALVMTIPHNAAREGLYAAQFTTTLDGDYRIELPVPQGDRDELLVREVHARLPDLEIEHPERNDPLLKHLSQSTDGAYFVGMNSVVLPNGRSPLVDAIIPQDHVTYIPGAPDQLFDEVLNLWLLVFLSTMLSLEWLIRRLHKLA